MAEAGAREGQSIDFRIYLGMILFRWQVITLCFLYSLLVGVVFLQITPKKYLTRVQIRSFTDPQLKIDVESPWASIDRHRKLLESMQARNEAIEKLAPEWGEKLGDKRKMYMDLELKNISAQSLRITVKSEYPQYAEALLTEILRIHEQMWDAARVSGSESGTLLLQKELDDLEERIRKAESAIFEFERLNDIRRVSLRAGEEDAYIGELVTQRRSIRTSLWMMEVEFPALRDADVGVIDSVGAFRLTQSGKLSFNPRGNNVDPLPPDWNSIPTGTSASETTTPGTTPAPAPGAMTTPGGGPADDKAPSEGSTPAERGLGWPAIRYELILLESKERGMAQNLKEDHPRLKQIRAQIAGLREQLQFHAELQFRNMMDNYRALQITHDALEAAEYKWQAVNWQRAQKLAELARLQAQLARYEKNYQTLYERLHDIKITEEMKAERFTGGTPVSTQKPVWPDPTRILLIALGVGLGLGGGLALVAQIFDNKVQSIQDVERSLGIPFLGGVPFWVHSGLEKAIRPIVTEEHSVGAVEAYRALRTSIVSAMEKAGEKILIVTSADSREGKTLTALNTAIMMAQMHRKVLLVDMDLRRGRLHRSLGLEKEPGITNVLKGERTLRSIVVPTRIENLYLAPPGPPVEDAPELLQSAGLSSFFVEIQDEFDYIVCDTSPVLRVTDTVIFASQGVGVVVYVARVNHTPKPLIRYSLDVLKDARVIGMVLNSIEMHKISSLYYTYQYPNYAYYSNAYSYGYSYAYYGDQADQENRKQKRRGGTLRTSKRPLKKWFSDTFLPTS
jgi:capsular exopolysaccharide synthesis family protein